MFIRTVRWTSAAVFLFLASTASAAEIRSTIYLSGKPAGLQIVERLGDPDRREWKVQSRYEDRGRGPDETTVVTLGADGCPAKLATDGHDYFKNPVAERFERAGDKASWKSSGEAGETTLSGSACYVPIGGGIELLGLVTRAALSAPNGTIRLLPAGTATARRLVTLDLPVAGAPGKTQAVELVELSGLAFNPIRVWFDADGVLFAQDDGWSTLLREGWDAVLPTLREHQEKAEKAREGELAARFAHRPQDGFVITGARLFDPATRTTRANTTIVVRGERIAAVGPDGQVEIPAGFERIDGAEKTVLPGLWDLHTHLSADAGPLYLAGGITSVRDLANDIEVLHALETKWNQGTAIGPRVVKAGFLDAPGPYAGPTKVLVSNEEEGNAAIDRYASLGYEQIKIYSSIPPALVPALVARARKHGMRVSGHIPAFMTAEQAVRAGYDEIQHINFIALNFLFDKVQDTRTPARFTEVAAHAAEIDLEGQPFRDFVALLVEKNVAVDVTVNIFEGMFLNAPGAVAPGWETVIDRLPPQLQRGLRAGGGLPIPDGMAGRYRDSWQKLLAITKKMFDAGVQLEAGTDGMAGFPLHRELELYVQAGIPAPEALKIATLDAARILKRDKDLGSIEVGKLADLIVVDGDPTAKISDIRKATHAVKGGVIFDTAAIYQAHGVGGIE